MHPELQNILQRRTTIIADRAWYERDPEGHLQALKSVSEEIESYHQAHKSEFDGQLRHFLKNASYQKALDYLSA